MNKTPKVENLVTLLQGEHSLLTIGFNEEHAINHCTAQEWHDEMSGYIGDEQDRIDWASEEERIKAIEENSVWTIQWYPATPIGFCCVGASTLEAALKYVFSKYATHDVV